MRLILLMGKGGVGKTTIAASTAVRCADLGYRTLVVSTDIAHSLADVLDHSLTGDPQEIKTNLWAQEINVLDEVRSRWHLLRESAAVLLRGEGVNPIVAEELAIAPGMDELASLLRIRDQSNSGKFEVIIVDAAPTGETVRLLTMPNSFKWYATRLVQWSESASGLAKTLGGQMVSKVLDLFTELQTQVSELAKMLADPKISSYRIVLNPERMVIKETQRALTYMNLFGYPVDAGIINRVLPQDQLSADPYFRSMQELQQTYLKIAHETFAPLPLFEVSWHSEQILGLSALQKLGADVWQDHDPTKVFWHGPLQQIEQRDDEYVLRLFLPHIEIGRVNVTKRGDELLIAIGNFKRELALPQALATREATKARLTDDGSLEIIFAQPNR